MIKGGILIAHQSTKSVSSKRFISFLSLFFPLPFLPGQEDRTGNKNGRIGTHCDPYDQGKSEVMDNPAAKNKKGDNHKQGGNRGQNGAAECFIDAAVYDEFQWILVVFSQVFANAVINDDGVVQ